jgi:hypothetical protein
MYANRGDTIQPNGYLEERPRAKEIEMQNYNQQREDPRNDNYKQDNSKHISSETEEQQTIGGYILHWVAFIVATGFYIGVWAIDYFVFQRQASYYYKNTSLVSLNTDNTGITDSTLLFATSINSPFDTVGVAMSLVYSWVLWKGPLVVYGYHLIEKQ